MSIIKISKSQYIFRQLVWGVKPLVASTFMNIIYFHKESVEYRSLTEPRELENPKASSIPCPSCQAPKKIQSGLSLQSAPVVASRGGSQDSHFWDEREKQLLSVEMPAEGRRQLLCKHASLPGSRQASYEPCWAILPLPRRTTIPLPWGYLVVVLFGGTQD